MKVLYYWKSKVVSMSPSADKSTSSDLKDLPLNREKLGRYLKIAIALDRKSGDVGSVFDTDEVASALMGKPWDRLDAAGRKSPRRTINRDLGKMVKEGLLVIHDNKRPRAYRVTRSGRARWQRLNPPPLLALGLQLAERHLAKLFTPELLAQYQEQVKSAGLFQVDDRQLDESIAYRELERSIAEISRGQPKLRRREVSGEHLELIYEAIKTHRQICFRYERTHRIPESLNGKVEYQVSPLGIVVRDPKMILYSRMESGDRPGKERGFDLSRVVSMRICEERISDDVIGFDMAAAAQEGALNYRGEERGEQVIDLVLHIKQMDNSDLLQELVDYPLNKSQKITCIDETQRIWELRANKILRTKPLEDWIISMWGVARVISPEHFGKYIFDKLNEAAELSSVSK